eukprot:3690263-Karenia_brevis.AAC.1
MPGGSVDPLAANYNQEKPYPWQDCNDHDDAETTRFAASSWSSLSSSSFKRVQVQLAVIGWEWVSGSPGHAATPSPASSELAGEG